MHLFCVHAHRRTEYRHDSTTLCIVLSDFIITMRLILKLNVASSRTMRLAKYLHKIRVCRANGVACAQSKTAAANKSNAN